MVGNKKTMIGQRVFLLLRLEGGFALLRPPLAFGIEDAASNHPLSIRTPSASEIEIHYQTIIFTIEVKLFNLFRH
ncbi:hypothetical protein [Methanocella conradii]|uniref:hypothetical protein n=1 Tax=Methanocella conradii TaxID=1175444 RepID=UPI00157DF9CC|nr:hypothetical protein [Methanocella conradii]